MKSKALLLATLGSLMATPAHAASLQPVANWGATGVPSYISMYIYVPDTLATNPPILVVSHFCGGSAAAVFGQAQGGGIVSRSTRSPSTGRTPIVSTRRGIRPAA